MASTILGISPGTRIMGLGVIQNGELVEWQVKTFKGSWSKEKLRLIIDNIQSISDHFKVSVIALKVVSPLRTSKNLLNLTKGIMETAEKNKIRLSRFTGQDLKLRAEPAEKHSSSDLMEFVLDKYPVLKREYLKERNNLNPYYFKMFEAIAAALIAERTR
ncbi:MAG: crossover junction endodeoxyribonuclease RuvC [Chitinophagales bacterium]|nr:crossover junction endodeoxyribonuclease RuvC [Chitinophagales bacterium]